MTRHLPAVCAAFLTAVGVAACAPAGLAAPAPGSTLSSPPVASTSPSQTASPTPSPSPSQSASPNMSPSPSVSASASASPLPADGKVPANVVQSWLQGDAKPDSKVVFLTFDDGPNDSITPQVLDILKQNNVHATFFVVGNAIDDAPDVLRRTYQEGHGIGLHSWNHNYKTLYPNRKGNAEEITSQAERSLAGVRAVLGEDFKTGAWRYPGGHMSWKKLGSADTALANMGLSWIDWNAMTGDAEPEKRRPTTVSGMVKMATAPIDEGVRAVVMLAHDAPGKNLTVQSLPEIIDAYRDAGYAFGVIA